MVYAAILLALVVGYLLGINRAYTRLEKCERMLDNLIKRHKHEDLDKPCG